ncbi:proline-specific peptidase [Irpex rosettiformis]|uniref:Proline-specific peptidase n=1 Tax=Irpex rosettiformis TaxID=378272 RepID=A0ACB8TXV2_9APHY|nr:proline-specific peptidase [Irpex rosettiformis]
MSFAPSLRPLVVEGEATFDYPPANKPLKTWYKVTGELTVTSIPLFILHGGPGVGAEAYNILSDLTNKYDIPIIQYDQVGCKRSTHLQEKADAGEEFWNENLFIAELHNLVRHFGLDAEGRQYDVLGHSWGGMFGASFAAEKPKNLRKLVIMSAAPSTQIWIDAQLALRKTLPEDVQQVMDKCEADGNTESEEYQSAMMQYYANFMCRLQPVPDEIMDGLMELRRDPTVYGAMWGPSEWYVKGTLKNWSVLDRVSTIDIPVLLLNGQYDEAQDSCITAFLHRLPKAKWVKLVGETSHMTHFEDRERYMQVVGEFLTDKPAI